MITHYFNFQLGQVRIRSGKTRIWVGLGSGYLYLDLISLGFI